MNKPNYNILTPFKRWTIQNFPFIEEDFDAITNYQLFSKMVEYLNKVIENEKELEKVNNELIDAFNSLKDYVDNYFENLDVQDEIDNKLDEMAESGQLTDIIAQYLGLAGVLAFDTVADLVSALNIVNGSICKTLGNLSYNDGKGAFYKIRTVTSDDTIDGVNIIALDVSNTLIAELIPYSNTYNIYKELQDKTNKKIILITDSYGEQNTDEDITTFFYDIFKTNMGLTQDVNFFHGEHSGDGFGNNGFLTQLTNVVTNLTDKNSISDVLVCGGWNDSDTTQPYGTDEAFNSGISAFNNYVKTNLPNAKVTIAHISWGDPYITHTNTIFEQMPTSLRRYKEASNKYGWRYLTGTENILHYYNEDFWQSDGNHPSQDGQTLLGNEITRAFTTGSTNIFRLHAGTLSGSGISEFINYGTLYALNNGDVTELFIPKSNVGIYVKATSDVQTINCDGAHEYEIGTINSLEAYGYSPYLLATVPCYFTGTFNGTNSTYMGYTEIFIYGSKLYIRPTLFIGGSRAESFDYNYIWIPNFKIVAPTRYC